MGAWFFYRDHNGDIDLLNAEQWEESGLQEEFYPQVGATFRFCGPRGKDEPPATVVEVLEGDIVERLDALEAFDAAFSDGGHIMALVWDLIAKTSRHKREST